MGDNRGLACPHCHTGKQCIVIDTRKHETYIRRRRRCDECSGLTTTYEVIATKPYLELKKVYRAALRERKYQDDKWGNNPHEVGAWLLIMQAELDEAKEAWVKGTDDGDALGEILQVIAVGMACLEQHGVKERGQPPEAGADHWHWGDPCEFCGVPHDDVAVGDCPGRDGGAPK